MKPLPPTDESLAELADRCTADIPDEEWDTVPADLARNLDHYLYDIQEDDAERLDDEVATTDPG